MRLRHIVVEGCDGTGKTTLINELLTYKRHRSDPQPHFLMHERASRSKEGPVPDLDGWVDKDLSGLREQMPSVYDRHPLISEPVYGPIIRGSVPGKFNDGVWCTTGRGVLATYALVVWCVPPWEWVRRNIENSQDNQMPGVMINARRIYDTYMDMSLSWPGVCYRHDPTNPARPVHGYIDLVFGG